VSFWLLLVLAFSTFMVSSAVAQTSSNSPPLPNREHHQKDEEEVSPYDKQEPWRSDHQEREQTENCSQ
jgi:hypothetical protein